MKIETSPAAYSPASPAKSLQAGPNQWINLLRCPDCGEKFRLTVAASDKRNHETEGDYGILQCPCFRYPIVDGVPIILKGHVGLIHQGGGELFESKGPAVDEITRLVESGSGYEALIRCLAFAPRFEILDRLPGWRLWHGELVSRFSRAWIERRLREMLSRGRSNLCAEDWFHLYFGSHTASDANYLPYYRNRFALPRTLASLALLQLLPRSDRPVLDLGCGFGPFPHYLTKRRDATPAVGVDVNFHLTWGQKHWIAPHAAFVCADGNKRLPFADDAFSGIFCSDTFMYLHDRPTVLAELERCAPGRPTIISRAGNRMASPTERWGDPCSVDEYMQLFAWGEPRAFSEYALVRHYLARRNPLAGKPTDPGELCVDKWLHFAMNTQDLVGVRVDAFDEWPHRVGELAYNPIFEQQALPGEKRGLAFTFPDVWFAYQNSDMYCYHADKLECGADALERARSGDVDAEVRELLDRFVLIGLPERYLRSQQ